MFSRKSIMGQPTPVMLWHGMEDEEWVLASAGLAWWLSPNSWIMMNQCRGSSLGRFPIIRWCVRHKVGHFEDIHLSSMLTHGVLIANYPVRPKSIAIKSRTIWKE